ncbi:MAG: UDP-N-acetylglucosamine 2-epimerase [Schleiferiaceae bacterium]|nr:UDP-N-acetylglucosamine 2-epimerase [Schleiferiaceae bacterium]
MIAHIVGARPQFIKLLPLFQALARRGAPQQVLHSGQHWEAGMSEVFFNEFGLQPDQVLDWSNAHEENIQAMMAALEAWKPDTVVVYGDTFSTWCAARAAKRLGLALAHVEAGLRSFNAAMPEEEARVKTDTISDWHFVPSKRALAQLQREGLDRGPEHTVLTGDIMADALMERKPGKSTPGRILVTVHRNTNVDDPEIRGRILDALEKLADRFEIHWPIHPRLRAHLEEGQRPKNIIWHPPLGREALLEQLDAAEWVITDSGGLQKEAYFCQRNCLVLRNETEWVELMSTGHSWLLNPAECSDGEELCRVLEQALSRATSSEFPPVYGLGDAAERMADALWNEGPILPNRILLRGKAGNPQLEFAAEILRRVTGVRLDFTAQGEEWQASSLWAENFSDWIPENLKEDSLAKAAYLASRVEEFSPSQRDDHGRYMPEYSCQWESLQRNPEIPQGHVWLEAFVQRFRPDFRLSERRRPASTVVIDIDHRFAFKGFSRLHLTGVFLRNFFLGRWSQLRSECSASDAFDASDVFEGLMRVHKEVRWQFFAWIGPKRGPQDKGPSIRHSSVASAHSEWAKRHPSIGLHPSYAHHDGGQKALRTEVTTWKSATSHILQRSRYHYLRMNIPYSQKQLHTEAVLEDWSMEYAKHAGYRAGVAVPFPAWGVGPDGEAMDRDGIPYLTYVPVALMDQNIFHLESDEISTYLQRWDAAAKSHGAALVLASHWRFFGPGASLFSETAKYAAWKQGLQEFLNQQAS